MGILLWIAIVIFTGVIAASKNRNPIGWAFLALLFGPLALIVCGFMAALPSQDAVRAQSAQSQPGQMAAEAARVQDIVTCPFCAEDIKREAVVCKHCGRDLPMRGNQDGRGSQDLHRNQDLRETKDLREML